MVNFLKRYFAENLITQQEIESKTGISQSKISLTLNNKRKLTAEELLKIAISFDINLEELKKDIKLA
jgi:transcriptional regulator with XRE-family HTH domain